VAQSLLQRLIDQGDSVSIELGRLRIVPASGRPVPEGWLEGHSKELIGEILMALGQDAYEYVGYATGD
jgi:hypothetical protein